MKRVVFAGLSFLIFAILATMVAAVGPVLNAIPAQIVNENSAFSVTIIASAPDSGSTAFNASIAPAPSAGFLASMTLTRVDDTQAVLSGTPTYADAGVYVVTITAADSNSSDTKSFTLTVNDVPAPGPQLVIDALGFGGENQRKSNPDADDVEDRDEFVTDTFVIRNTGGATATGIVLSPTFSRGSTSDYRMNFTNAPATLAPGESRTVTARIRIPAFIDAVDGDLQIGAVTVGQLAAVSNGGTVSSNAADMTMQVENHLQLKKIKVCHEDKCETVNDGDTVDKVKPGEHIQVTIQVENSYSQSKREDVDIRDIEVDLDTNDDQSLDLSHESEDVGDLSAGDDDSVTIEFDVNDDADDGTAEFTVIVDGDDQFRSRQGESARIRLDINRERHEIAVKSFTISPETVSCSRNGQGTAINARVTASNIGRDDENEISIEVKINDLNLGQITRDISIDKDDEESFSFNLNLPANVAPGTYEVDATTYVNRDEVSNHDSTVLTVPDCAGTAGVGFEQPPARQTQQPSSDDETQPSRSTRRETQPEEVVVQTTPTMPGAAPVVPTTSSVRRSNSGFGSAYVIALLAIIVILVLVGVGLIVAIAKKPMKQQ